MKKIGIFILLVVLFFGAFAIYGLSSGDDEKTNEENIEQETEETENSNEVEDEENNVTEDTTSNETEEDLDEETTSELEDDTELEEESLDEESPENEDEVVSDAPQTDEQQTNDSANKNIEGVYTGLIDSQSIEVSVNGVAETFMFGGNLQEKIYNITENSDISITYSTNSQGNKIINNIEEK